MGHVGDTMDPTGIWAIRWIPQAVLILKKSASYLLAPTAVQKKSTVFLCVVPAK